MAVFFYKTGEALPIKKSLNKKPLNLLPSQYKVNHLPLENQGASFQDSSNDFLAADGFLFDAEGRTFGEAYNLRFADKGEKIMEQKMKEMMKKEADKRIKILIPNPNAIREFIEKGILNKSERTTGRVYMGDGSIKACTAGALYWLNDEEVQLIKKIEEKWNILVYHVSHEYLEFGECYDLFYVSSFNDEWPDERQDLEINNPFVYVYNKTDPDFSEFGYIQVNQAGGGVIRTE